MNDSGNPNRRAGSQDEIRELTARYCHAVTDGDGLAIVDLSVRTACFECATRWWLVTLSSKTSVNGVGGQTHKPFIQNHVIEIESDTEASGVARWKFASCKMARLTLVLVTTSTGTEKKIGKWRIADRHYNAYHFVPLKDGWTSNGALRLTSC